MTNPHLSWLRDLTILVGKAGKNDQWLRAHNLVDILDAAGLDIPGVKDGKGI